MSFRAKKIHCGTNKQARSRGSCDKCGLKTGFLISRRGRNVIREKEVERARNGLSKGAILTGFDANGEILSFKSGVTGWLHNHTATTAELSEA